MKELNERQKQMMNEYLKGTFNQFTVNESDRALFMQMIDEAEKLMFETDEDTGDDLMAWYWEKYQAKFGK